MIDQAPFESYGMKGLKQLNLHIDTWYNIALDNSTIKSISKTTFYKENFNEFDSFRLFDNSLCSSALIG